jgi:MFS superfamily sulfate permease-like transporter
VLIDAESVDFVDTSACDALLHLAEALRAQGITLAFARVRDPVREAMRLGGFEAAVGPANFHERITDGVAAWRAASAHAIAQTEARTTAAPAPGRAAHS